MLHEDGFAGADDADSLQRLEQNLTELAKTMDDLNAALTELLQVVRQHSVKLMFALEAMAPHPNDSLHSLLN